VVRVRSRGTLDAAFIDIDIAVEPATTTDHTAAIADAVRTAFADKLPGLDEVEIHFVPTKAPDDAAHPNYALIARAAADALGLSVHEVRMIDRPAVPDTLWVIGTGKLLEMHVEVAPGQTLNEAHEQVTTLELQLRAQLPEINEIITHIEPMGAGQINGLLAQACIRLQKEAKTLLDREYPLLNWHDLRAVPLDNGCALTLHVTLPGTLTLERAHQIAESAEAMLRSTLPRLTRVTIHTEPIEAP